MMAVSVVKPRSLSAAEFAAETEALVDNGGYAVQKHGQYLVTHNLHKTYVPASIIKIATTLAALDILGPEYRFSTKFYLDAQQNLYIQGTGDPFLVSEEVAIIVANLKKKGCSGIRDINIDNSLFAIQELTDGAGLSDNPYDAQNSGLAVNFNTVKVRKKDGTGRVMSAEEQTPTLPLMADLAEDLEPGTHRINITRAKKNGAAIISLYAGELFSAMLQRENIAVAGKIKNRTTPADLEPVYIHQSGKSLEGIIAPLMLYSNNFIANQIFLAVGAARYGNPATWEKGRAAVAEYLQKKYSLSAGEIKMVEGSGLSRKNRISAHAMLLLLDSFKPYARLLPRENGRLLKSGTLKGVYTYAGYFTENERLDSFVLLLNQERNNRDKVLGALERIYQTSTGK